jgi:hypothetical protein
MMKVRRQVESDGKMRPIGGLYDDDTPSDVRRSRVRRFRRTMKQVVHNLIKGNDEILATQTSYQRKKER